MSRQNSKRLDIVLIILILVVMVSAGGIYLLKRFLFNNETAVVREITNISRPKADDSSSKSSGSNTTSRTAEQPRPQTTTEQKSASRTEKKVKVKVRNTAVSASPNKRRLIRNYSVREGDSVSGISRKFWDDLFLWPDMYTSNTFKSPDPDLVYPREIVRVYERLGKGNTFSPNDLRILENAYLKVYRRYRSLPKKKQNSITLLLYGALKYDRNFLEKYRAQIAPDDVVRVKRFIKEKGTLN